MKETNPSDRGSEYDTAHPRKARAKQTTARTPLSLAIESSTLGLASSTADTQNGQVVPGPGASGIGVVEIGFERWLLDPSATEGRAPRFTAGT